jgi:hypothetical protein
MTVTLGAAVLLLAATGAARGQCELQKLGADDADITDWFGSAVAGSATRVVVGAMQDSETSAQGGAAYVFGPNEGGVGPWTQVVKLLPDDPGEFDNFGWSVALDGDTVLVGARFDDVPGGTSAGSVYVFRLVEGAWTQEAKLFAPDANHLDWFGIDVALCGDTALIGARMQDEGAVDAGAAYVYVRDGSTWSMQQKLLSPAPAEGDHFGTGVDLQGDTAVVGTPYADDAGPDAGAAHVFRRVAGAWSWEATLMAPSIEENDRRFGISVALDAPRVLAGAPLYSHDDGTWAGAGYMFVDDGGGSWSFEDRLIGRVVDGGTSFGGDVDLVGDRALISSTSSSLVAIAFERIDGAWVETWTMTPFVYAAGFGWAIGLAGDHALVGAPQDNVPPLQSGSVSVYDVSRTPCPADTTYDCTVNFGDVLELIGAWGTDGPGANIAPPLDDVTFADVLGLIAAWGPCP